MNIVTLLNKLRIIILMSNNKITRSMEIYVLEMAVISKIKIKKILINKFKSCLWGKKMPSKNKKLREKIESYMFTRKMKR